MSNLLRFHRNSSVGLISQRQAPRRNHTKSAPWGQAFLSLLNPYCTQKIHLSAFIGIDQCVEITPKEADLKRVEAEMNTQRTVLSRDESHLKYIS